MKRQSLKIPFALVLYGAVSLQEDSIVLASARIPSLFLPDEGLKSEGRSRVLRVFSIRVMVGETSSFRRYVPFLDRCLLAPPPRP